MNREQAQRATKPDDPPKTRRGKRRYFVVINDATGLGAWINNKRDAWALADAGCVVIDTKTNYYLPLWGV